MLQRHPEMFARAVLTAPMIAPSSAPFRSLSARQSPTSCAHWANQEMAFIGKPFDPASETFESSFSTSHARGFDYYEQKRIHNAHCKTAHRPTAG